MKEREVMRSISFKILVIFIYIFSLNSQLYATGKKVNKEIENFFEDEHALEKLNYLIIKGKVEDAKYIIDKCEEGEKQVIFIYLYKKEQYEVSKYIFNSLSDEKKQELLYLLPLSRAGLTMLKELEKDNLIDYYKLLSEKIYEEDSNEEDLDEEDDSFKYIYLSSLVKENNNELEVLNWKKRIIDKIYDKLTEEDGNIIRIILEYPYEQHELLDYLKEKGVKIDNYFDSEEDIYFAYSRNNLKATKYFLEEENLKISQDSIEEIFSRKDDYGIDNPKKYLIIDKLVKENNLLMDVVLNDVIEVDDSAVLGYILTTTFGKKLDKREILDLAIEKESINIVIKLIENGLDISYLKNKEVNKIYYVLLYYGDREKIDILLRLLEAKILPKKSFGYDEFERDDEDEIYNTNNNYNVNVENVLFYAIKTKQNEIAKLLIDKNINTNPDDNMGVSPYKVAIGYNNLEILEYLIEKGKDINYEKTDENIRNILFDVIEYSESESKCIELLDCLIKKEANYKAKDYDGGEEQNLIFYASLKGYSNVIKKLIDLGLSPAEDINKLNESIRYSKNKHVFDILIEFNPDFDYSDIRNNILIVNAIADNDYNFFNFLLGKGVPILNLVGLDIDNMTYNKYIIKYLAMVNPKMERIDELVSLAAELNDHDTYLEIFNKKIFTSYYRTSSIVPFVRNFEEQNPEKIDKINKLILKDIKRLYNNKKTKENATRLLISYTSKEILSEESDYIDVFQSDAYYLDKEVLEFLVKKGADINYKDSSGRNIFRNILYYFRENKKEGLEYLILNGAKYDENLIVKVLINNNCEEKIILDLINKGVKADYLKEESIYTSKMEDEEFQLIYNLMKNNYSNELLSKILVRKLKVSDIYSLIDSNIKINKSDIEKIFDFVEDNFNINERLVLGETILLKYLELENKYEEVKIDLEVVEYLLKKGANPNIKNSFGETALLKAVRRSDIKLIKLLLKYNADVNIKYQNGETILEICKDNKEILKALNSNNNFKVGDK